MSEHDEQKAVVRWFYTKYPEYKECLIGIPNGAYLAGSVKQRCAQINKLKSEGLKSGTSDIFIAVPMRGYHGLWVEMKDKKKTYSSVSSDQRRHLTLMANLNYRATWCAGFEAAKEVIEEYMRPDYEG